jgi:hypothetical protein
MHQVSLYVYPTLADVGLGVKSLKNNKNRKLEILVELN